MRLLFFIFLFQLGTASTAQIKSPGTLTYGIPYDTIYLKNETKLIFMTNNENRSIRMVNTNIDTTIRSISIKYPKCAVGWMKADFENYFILYGRLIEPNYMMICNKSTGKIIAEGDVMEFDTTEQIICYADWNRPYVINLFDFASSKYAKYISPRVPCLHWWYCVQIIGITEKELTIQYMGMNNVKMKKVYVR